MKLGQRVRARRDALSLTLHEVARHAGISASYLSDIERGRRVPPVETLQRIAITLDVPVSSLDKDATFKVRVGHLRPGDVFTAPMRLNVETTNERSVSFSMGDAFKIDRDTIVSVDAETWERLGK